MRSSTLSSPNSVVSCDDEAEAPTPPHTSRPGNKHSHCLSAYWFIVPTNDTFQKYFSASISKSTAANYNSHVQHWLSHCQSNDIDPIDPSLKNLITYLASRAQSMPSTSVLACLSLIRKLFAANLARSDLFNHPSVSAFTQGLNNLPKCSNSNQKIQLTMSKAALQLAGHMVQSQPGWSRRDINMTWTLLLICYYSL